MHHSFENLNIQQQNVNGKDKDVNDFDHNDGDDKTEKQKTITHYRYFAGEKWNDNNNTDVQVV